MRHTLLAFVSLLLMAFAAFAAPAPSPPKGGTSASPPANSAVFVPILLYHRFGPTVADGMTVTTANFEDHLKYLKENGYTVIPLRELVAYVRGRGPAPAPKSVVIVEDDAHISVYTEMAPLVKKYRVPVTIFVYPSAISNASYAMTWDQLRELQGTGLFDIQSHTFYHPNFKQEKKKLPATEYSKFVDSQLLRSKERIEKQMGRPVEFLAWPFGIYDDELIAAARKAGYVATFTIDAKAVKSGDDPMRLHRFLLPNGNAAKILAPRLMPR